MTKGASGPNRHGDDFAQTDDFVQEVHNEFGPRPRIMLTEQGVEIGKSGQTTNLYGSPSAQRAAATRFLQLGTRDNSISLVDYYQLFGDANFDTALVEPPTDRSIPQLRPAYCVLTGQDSSVCSSDGH